MDDLSKDVEKHINNHAEKIQSNDVSKDVEKHINNHTEKIQSAELFRF